MKNNPFWREGTVYRLLAINAQMLEAGLISQQEHDLVRSLQLGKLTELRQNGKMGS